MQSSVLNSVLGQNISEIASLFNSISYTFA